MCFDFFFPLGLVIYTIILQTQKPGCCQCSRQAAKSTVYFTTVPKCQQSLLLLWQLENCNLELKAYPCNKDWLVKFYKEMRILAAGCIWILLERRLSPEKVVTLICYAGCPLNPKVYSNSSIKLLAVTKPSKYIRVVLLTAERRCVSTNYVYWVPVEKLKMDPRLKRISS